MSKSDPSLSDVPVDRRAFLSSTAAAGMSLFLGCAGRKAVPESWFGAGPAENVIVIVSDALRGDVVGKKVRGNTIMPNVERLAEAGTRFTTCIAPSSWTLFSVPAMLCSMAPLPDSHSVNPKTSYFPETAVNIAEVFASQGMMTAAVVKNPWLYQKPGLKGKKRRLFARGFETYLTPVNLQPQSHPGDGPEPLPQAPECEDGKQLTDMAMSMLKRKVSSGDERPFFFYLHYMDTHDPYYPPLEFRKRFLRGPPLPGIADFNLTGALREAGKNRNYRWLIESDQDVLERSHDMYNACANYVDYEVGRLLGFLRESGLLEKTLIVFTADHGEEFGEHFWIAHTRSLYREVLEVPLVIAGPGVSSGKTVHDMVSLLDVAPALLKLLGLASGDAPFDGEGEALLGKVGRHDVVSTTRFPSGTPEPSYFSTSLTMRNAKKYIRTVHLDKTGKPEKIDHKLFDLRNDPDEKDNYAASAAAYCQAQSSRLDSLMAARKGGAGMTVVVPDVMKESLKSLGYLN